MKTTTYLVGFQISFLVLISGCKSQRANLPSSSPDLTQSQLAHHRTSDLRVLFLPEADIDRLESEHRCRIEYYRHKVEMVVDGGLPLNKLVLSYMKHGYDGQIKVISRDSIRQTSLRTYDPSEQERITVNPGDLIYIQGRD